MQTCKRLSSTNEGPMQTCKRLSSTDEGSMQTCKRLSSTDEGSMQTCKRLSSTDEGPVQPYGMVLTVLEYAPEALLCILASTLLRRLSEHFVT